MRRLIGYLFILLALAVFTYPTIGSIYQEYRASQAIDIHTENLIKQGNNEQNEEREKCISYNRTLAIGSSPVSEKAQTTDAVYESLLNTGGIMGVIEIPKISQKLPIYHYSNSEELERGIGHIHGSSLPVGGESTNCVLTGHRGLPGNLLFTRLDEMQNGDMIYLTVLGDTLAYQIYDIQTVLPEQVEAIKIERGQDLVTLITCTPYAVNTHRLIITARRVLNETQTQTYTPVTTITAVLHAVPMTRLYIAGAVIILIIAAEIILALRRHHEKKS